MPARFCAQPGFSKVYDFGQIAANFGTVIQDGDALVAFGTCKEPGQPEFGLLFAKLDTNGNIQNYNIYNDSLDDAFTQTYPESIIKLSSDSGFAAVGQVFYRANGFMAKYDNDGNLQFIKEYPDSTSEVDFYYKILEVNGGYLVAGRKFRWVGEGDIFVLRLDTQGNKIWEKTYGTIDRNEGFSSLIKMNDDEFVIGAFTTSPQGTPLQQIKNTSLIFAIDSLGNVKWNWESQPSLEELGVGHLFKTADGNWAYQSGRAVYNPTYNELSRQPKFIIRDSNFNLLSDASFGTANSTLNSFYHTIQSGDGGWLCVGTQNVHYPIPPVPIQFNALTGWMVRLDGNGDSLWSRIDTAYWSYNSGSENYLNAVIELPGGSIVSCGQTILYEGPFAPRSLGWLIKVDMNGCLDTLNCATTEVLPASYIFDKINVFPNPTSAWLNIDDTEDHSAWDQIELLNCVGQSVQTVVNKIGRIDMSGLPDGIYYLIFSKSGQNKATKIIKTASK